MALTLADAHKAAQAAVSRAEKLNITIAVAVLDDRGDPILIQRMDGARWFTADVARGKAFATSTFRRASGELAGMADAPFFRSMLHMHQGRLVFGPGAAPLMRNNAFEGAIGVSGGTGEQDDDCAKAGAAAL